MTVADSSAAPAPQKALFSRHHCLRPGLERVRAKCAAKCAAGCFPAQGNKTVYKFKIWVNDLAVVTSGTQEFETAEEAARAFDAVNLAYRGPNAQTNFPVDSIPESIGARAGQTGLVHCRVAPVRC